MPIYRGWKNDEIHGIDLGKNKQQAIAEAKRLKLDMVLQIFPNKDGIWIWNSGKQMKPQIKFVPTP